MKQSMNVIQRVKAPTPKFYRILRAIGISLAVAGGTLMASPVALPAFAIAAGGYITVAGSVLTAVSQTAVEPPKVYDDEPDTQP